MMRNVQLSIVIPAFNERERLAQSLETLSAHLSRSGHRDAEEIGHVDSALEGRVRPVMLTLAESWRR